MILPNAGGFFGPAQAGRALPQWHVSGGLSCLDVIVELSGAVEVQPWHVRKVINRSKL